MLSATRFQQIVLVAAVVVPATVFGAAAWWNRGEVLREGGELVERTASIMHEHVAKVFDTADLVLDRVQDRIDGRIAARQSGTAKKSSFRKGLDADNAAEDRDSR